MQNFNILAHLQEFEILQKHLFIQKLKRHKSLNFAATSRRNVFHPHVNALSTKLQKDLSEQWRSQEKI